MSLIQQALDKMNRSLNARTEHLIPKLWMNDPMGTRLEQELTQAQQRYARRRNFYWQFGAGVLIVGLIGGLSFLGSFSSKQTVRTKTSEATSFAKIPAAVTTIIPQRSILNARYRLTGVTQFDNKAVAVINGDIVGVGDSLAGKATVKKIGNKEVLLDAGGREIRLTL